MSYSTGSGTFETMMDNLAAFAVANGWVPHTPAPHRYWSILGRTRDESGTNTTELDFIGMSETSGGANVLTGGTASATAGTADNALVDDGTPWTANLATTITRWTYDLGLGNDKNVVEVTINFTSPTFSYRFFELQFSDDGSTWTTLKAFFPNITTTGETFVGLWVDDEWPLSPDGDNFVDYVLETGLDTTGYTLEGGSFPITDYSQLYLNVGRESLSPITLQGATIKLPLLDIDEWHFFADDTSAVHIHVAFRLTYRGETYWHHLSAGEIDKKGMGHNGVAYCTTSLMCSMVETVDTNPATFTFHNTLEACGYFIGRINTSLTSSLCYRLTQTGGNFPYPDDGNFPARVTSHYQGEKVMPTLLARLGARRSNNQLTPAGNSAPPLGSEGWRYIPHPTTRFVTLGALPFVVGNSTDASTGEIRWLGEFPNVRGTRIDDLEPGAEVEVGADTWMCFPLLKKVSLTGSSWPDRVAQSGPAGIAYKKVVA